MRLEIANVPRAKKSGKGKGGTGKAISGRPSRCRESAFSDEDKAKEKGEGS